MSHDIDHITKLATTKGYRELWQGFVSEGMTQREAFWEVEEEYRELFNEKKYKTFKSFYMSRYRHIKNKLSKN